MALSERQKHKIIYYLGWSGLTIVENSTQYNTVVNNRLDNTNAEIERIVKGLLERLEAIDEQLDQANCRLSASRVDGVEMNPREIEMLRKQRKKWICELSDHLAIPITRSCGANKTVVC